MRLRSLVRVKCAATLLAAMLIVASHQPAQAAGSVQLGAELAQRLCASCHGIGRAERSPIPVATPFRRLEARVDLDDMLDRLQKGIIAGHPEMPAFVLKEDEALAIVAYIRSLRD